MVGNDLLQILEALGAGDISIEEAARRAHLYDAEPGRVHCGTCKFFKANECWRPGQPPRSEHAYSVRCGAYVEQTRRDTALPVEAGGSRMFK